MEASAVSIVERQHRNYRKGEMIADHRSLMRPEHALRRDRQEPGNIRLFYLRIHARSLLQKARQAVGRSKGNRNYLEDKRKSYESIVPVKLGHRN